MAIHTHDFNTAPRPESRRPAFHRDHQAAARARVQAMLMLARMQIDRINGRNDGR